METETKKQTELTKIVTTATFSKLLLNTSRRFIYPFAPAIARGLGIPLSSVTGLIAINQVTSVFGPLFAPFGDRYGYKIMLLLALTCLTVGMFAAGTLPLYSVLMVSLFLAGLAKNIYDPALQALVGETVPYEKRGFVIGILEIAWALSTLIGIPAAGYLIETWHWQTPFILFGVLSLVSLVITWFVFPSDKKKYLEPDIPAERKKNGLIQTWRILLKQRAVMGIALTSFFMAFANDNLFVVYGAWLEDSFQLSLIAIGLGTSVIGFSEIIGEFLTAFFSDKIGLKRSILIGLFFCIASYISLPFLNQSSYTAFAGLFLVFLSFEFTVVTCMSLCTELVPEYRASTMSAFFAIGGIGRVLGAFAVGLLWTAGGIKGIAILSGCLTVCALLSFFWGLYHWKE